MPDHEYDYEYWKLYWVGFVLLTLTCGRLKPLIEIALTFHLSYLYYLWNCFACATSKTVDSSIVWYLPSEIIDAHCTYNLPGVANRQSPSLQLTLSAHRKRLFSSLAAEPGRNMLSTATSSLFSLARRIRSAPTVLVVKWSLDFICDDR